MSDPSAFELPELPARPNELQTIYSSGDERLVIKVAENPLRVFITHDLKTMECKKYRLRAVTKLQAALEEQYETIAEYAPGASTRLTAERTAVGIRRALEMIEKLWPEVTWGPTPTADEVSDGPEDV